MEIAIYEQVDFAILFEIIEIYYIMSRDQSKIFDKEYRYDHQNNQYLNENSMKANEMINLITHNEHGNILILKNRI